MKLWSELRRREVLRMAALYVVTAWLIMQVVQVTIALLELPARYGRTAMLVLAIGLPIALVLSWFLDITRSGIRRESSVDGEAPRPRSRRTDFAIIAILAAALAVFTYVQTGPSTLEQSVAVLPFENLTGDPGEDSLADGVALEVLHRLTTFGNLRVIARNSSFDMRDAAIGAIASNLKVGHVLRGSVRRSGNELRITTSLINTRSDESVWSKSYDANLAVADLFQVQVDIARAIAGDLRAKISSEAEAQMAKPPTQNLEAYRLYLLGLERMDQGRLDALGQAAGFLERAIEIDPLFAEPRIALVHVYFLMRNRVPPDEQRWEELIERALEINDQLGEAYAAQAAYVITNDAVLDKSRFERALQLSPGSAFVHEMYADYLRQQLFECSSALKIYHRGSQLDPLNANLHQGASHAYYCLLQWDQAKQSALKAIEVDPGYAAAYSWMGWIYGRADGALDQSMLWYRRGYRGDSRISVLNIARLYANLGDFDEARRWLKQLEHLLDKGPDWDPLEVRQVMEYELVKVAHIAGQHDLELTAGGEEHFAIEHRVAAEEYEAALAHLREENPEYFQTGDPGEIADPFRAILFATSLDRTGASREAEALWAYVEDLLLQKLRSEPAYLGAAGMAVRSLAYVCQRKDDTALELLASAFENRWRLDWRWILTHPCFDDLREDARFVSIWSRFEADMARQLENVREMERNGDISPM